jgi:hypothetical protein
MNRFFPQQNKKTTDETLETCYKLAIIIYDYHQTSAE